MRPVYGSHLKQILVTMGGLIVAEQAIHAIWGASPIPIAAAADPARRLRARRHRRWSATASSRS